jgi:hypothetical protein
MLSNPDFQVIPGVLALIPKPGQQSRYIFRISEGAKKWDGHGCDIAVECPRTATYAPCLIKITGRKVRIDYRSWSHTTFRVSAQIWFPAEPWSEPQEWSEAESVELIFSESVELDQVKSLFETPATQS